MTSKHPAPSLKEISVSWRFVGTYTASTQEDIMLGKDSVRNWHSIERVRQLRYQVSVSLSAGVQGAFLNGLPPHCLLVEGNLHMVDSLHQRQTSGGDDLLDIRLPAVPFHMWVLIAQNDILQATSLYSTPSVMQGHMEGAHARCSQRQADRSQLSTVLCTAEHMRSM